MTNKLLIQATLLAAAICLIPSEGAQALSSTPTQSFRPIIIQDASLEVQIDRQSGLLRRIVDKKGKIELQGPPSLAESYRLILDDAEIRSCRQSLGKTEPLTDGVRLIWPGPLRDEKGTQHAIEVRLDVRVNVEGLTFSLDLRNHSGQRIREVMYPFLGGVNAFARAGEKSPPRLAIPSGASFREFELPLREQTSIYPKNMAMAFVDVHGLPGGRSLYFASHDRVARAKVFRTIARIDGQVSDMALCYVHQPFTPAEGAFAGSPVVLRFHDGSWREGARIYRHWFQKQFGIADPEGNWIRRNSFVLDTMFMLPEGNLNLTFKDIPQWARDAGKYGIEALLISGWHCGGHDSGYPQYSPDPRLGTWDDLRAGIEAIHALGMRVYFFVNYQPIDMTSAWYEKELKDYAVRDLDGKIGLMGGWGMGTLEARLGKSKPNGFADLSIPQYRKILVDDFRRLVEIGADGLHVDKMYIWNPLSFNPLSTMSPDEAECRGAIELTENILKECRAVNPEFSLSFETAWDRVLTYTGAIWWAGAMDCARWAFPEMAPTVAVTQPFDFLGINTAVRQGQCVLLGPAFYCRSMDWEPWRPLSRYIAEIKRIRDELNETVSWGEPLDESSLLWETRLPDGLQANLWRNRRTGLHACILTNSLMKDQETALTGMGNKRGQRIRVRIPFCPDRTVDLPGRLKVPAEGIAFLVEETGPGPIEIQNEHVLVSVDPGNGAIRRIFDKAGGVELISEKRLADNFKFTLPVRGPELWQSSEGNFIIGRDQVLSRSERGRDRLTLYWEGPLKNERGVAFDVSARLDIELAGPAVVFKFSVRNQSPQGLGEVYYPILAGLRGLGTNPDEQVQTQLLLPQKESFSRLDIFRTFVGQNELGSAGPEQSYDSSWAALVQPRLGRSVRLEAVELDGHPFRRVYLEMWPGVASLRQDGNWPRMGELEGRPAGIRLSFIEILNTPGGRGFTSSPVRLEFGTGESLPGD